LRKVATFWLFSENILAIHGPMNVKLIDLTMFFRVKQSSSHWTELCKFSYFGVLVKTCQHT